MISRVFMTKTPEEGLLLSGVIVLIGWDVLLDD